MKKLKACVCIDASNIHYYLVKAGWRVDWRKFKLFCEKLYESPMIFYYEGVPSKSQYFDVHSGHSLRDFIEAKKNKLNYFKFLRSLSFKVRHKPVGRIYDNTAGEFKHKCNFDVELTIDVLDGIERYDVFVLLSGDGDFVKLIKYLKGKKKKTVVIAPSERLSDNLEEAANQVIYLEDIEEEIRM
ncbi:MAG: NYN domain-containing protein [Deltaproteobacteria bacterium]|nr:NYN domain-containing protein [Deltaproteobacteria bacterium]